MYGERVRPWNPATGRPSDDQLMDLLRRKIAELAPEIASGSRVDQGFLVGPGSWSLMPLPNHTGRPGHFDIGFVPADHAAPVLADCINGVGPMDAAVDHVVDVWARTSGACFLSMLTGSPRWAARLDGSHPAAMPGWHTISSGVVGHGPDAGALADAMAIRPVLSAAAPALPRSSHNGIKVYLHRTPDSTTTEIRVNGVPDPSAAQRMAALPWPEVSAPSTVRFYAVALAPA